MKFRLKLPIQKSREEVWEAFDNPENMRKWQPSRIRFEPVSGTRGRPDAVSKLTYSENNREFVFIVAPPQSRFEEG
jgi:uncharacterized protein YndB with AHSA1/START domain